MAISDLGHFCVVPMMEHVAGMSGNWLDGVFIRDVEIAHSAISRVIWLFWLHC